MPDTRPRIVFDGEGICNACRNAEERRRTDWGARRAAFEALLAPHRSRDGRWDVIVPWSGGKDSSTIAWRLKYEYGMNPLLATFSPLIPNEVGMHNREAMVRAGFDHVFFRPDQRVSRRLARRFFIERGNPKVHWDAGINAVPLKEALGRGIRLVVYAEHGESQYGGRVLREESKKVRDVTEVLEHQIGDDPRNWVDEEVSLKDLNPYIYPDPNLLAERGIQAIYFAYFHPWSPFENARFIRQKIDFWTDPEGRTEGTFTDFDSLDDKIDPLYYYMQYIKFGFGRASRDASRMVYGGHLTREEALEYARRYDAEFPARYFEECLAYLGLTSDEFHSIVDAHRNDEIWIREGETWRLRYPPC